MSTSVFRLIPTAPSFVPPLAAQTKALARFREFCGKGATAQKIVTDEIEFIDQGENFESVSCPGCKSELETSWWQDAMDAAYKKKFEDLGAVCPSCSAKVALNDLRYDWPAGFARFRLETEQWNHAKGLSSAQRNELESILGCTLREIWARY